MDKRCIGLIFLMFCGEVWSSSEKVENGPKIPEILLQKVKEGDAETAYFIATAFRDGQGQFEVDVSKARSWFQKAAEMNHVHSMFELALMMFWDKEYEGAQQWFQKAADQGHGESFYRLANYHVFGYQNQAVDCQTAYQLYKEAQLRGVDVAFNDHAWMLSTMPDRSCRNGEKAWRLFSELESQSGRVNRLPLGYIDTKAAVLAEISEFNEAIATQAYVVENACGVFLEDHENKTDWMAAAGQVGDEFCSSALERLAQYMKRKPWREKPVSQMEDNDG